MQETLSFSDRDEFQRKSIAENIVKLLNPDTDISPLVIDGDWGTGKTEFSIKLKNLIIEQDPESKVIYIDAFKGDHAESPLLLIASAIARILPEKEKQAFIKKAIPAIRFGMKTVLKAGAGWVLRQETDNMAEEFQDAIKKASNAAIDGTVENILEDHIEAEKNINSLKTCIEELSAKQRTVIIIDELDRCKPNFSTSILEVIKHIFDTQNVYFILVTNTKQLRASINHIYGYSLDSQKYLDKFIKYTISLPDTFKNGRYENFKASVIYWLQLAKDSPNLSLIEKHIGEEVRQLITQTNLSLRETHTFARSLNIFQTLEENRITDRTYYIYRCIFIIAVFIHCFGDKNLLKEELTSESIDKLADLLKVDAIPYEFETTSSVSRITIIFYGIIKESIYINKRFAPKNEIELKKFDDLYHRFEDTHFMNSTVKSRTNDFIQEMSFIR
ncbi:KAP family NTPase [Citrobacter portucalensis]|uniref:KAP family NTPase n=1 Tax=Citrobacter portucalensis TaxID=1639133 RepID=UPI002B237E04|nr:P-loop NTPase fold protein [Citrobacter portucalensis]MEB0324352.1 P-loop NTPase fold protein [Citrobacter portucalensis]MEB0356635.1 P-loop NTPase fold protein [Citrobacter portucalensis]MEB0401955.1 P-loop NTPase fold protein [Citrobacter portucalensis]UDQ99917.1 AAA family ATPase [Citrobacter freundii]